jgi:amino acid transporter
MASNGQPGPLRSTPSHSAKFLSSQGTFLLHRGRKIVFCALRSRSIGKERGPREEDERIKLSASSLPARLSAPASQASKKKITKMTLWPLIAATFFMVSGGAYGTEEIVHGAGYARAVLILILTPLVWSMPVALMAGELSSALPEEGGYYAWVRRGMGDFWGFQEAWLSFTGSIFDMAIYPTLFVAYLVRLAPWFGAGYRPLLVAFGVVIVCLLLNLAGVRSVGISCFWLLLLLSAPFACIVLFSPFKIGALAGAHMAPVHSTMGLIGGTLIAMWNYMGWDNASTIAREVHNPQRTYPRALLGAVLLISLSYVLPVFAVWITGIPASAFETGSWADLAGLIGGNWLRVALVFGGMLSGFGMFNALLMSYARVPLAMAQDGMLPRFFTRMHSKTRAPWVAILFSAAVFSLGLGLGLERLVTLDVMLSGASVVLEFIALVALRIREPGLRRPFRVPGGLPGAILSGVFPLVLLSLSAIHSRDEEILGINALLFGALIILAGFLAYLPAARLRRRTMAAQPVQNT